MAQPKDSMGILDLMVRPGFCVKDHLIVKVNQAAERLQLAPGTDVRELLRTGKSEYGEFQGGCLYLTLSLFGQSWGTSVTRMDGFDVFLLEQEMDQSELNAMALAASELREPLASVMTTAGGLFPLVAQDGDPKVREQAARMNRGLFQMLRVIGNMSDAGYYAAGAAPRMETLDIAAFFAEIFAKNQALVEHTGISLGFTGLNQHLFCSADPEKLERAVLNILSNAVKFTPKDGSIEAKLIRKGMLLCLSVQDSGEGIAENVRGSVFSRYLRHPTIEDGRFGIGLGMVLVRSAAAQHGGTVLLDQPEGKGVRITMTMMIQQSSNTMVRCGIRNVDYAGEWDHSLIELSDCLPADLYDTKKIN